MGLYRVNPAADQSELGVVVGDCPDANDKFAVGCTNASGECGIRAGTFTPNFTVRSDGNVGIGTPTPGQKLEVAGNVLISGNGLTFADGSTPTTAHRALSLSDQNLRLDGPASYRIVRYG